MFLQVHGSVLLFLQEHHAESDEHRDGDQQRNEGAMEPGKAERLREGSAGDRYVMSSWVNAPDETTEAAQG